MFGKEKVLCCQFVEMGAAFKSPTVELDPVLGAQLHSKSSVMIGEHGHYVVDIIAVAKIVVDALVILPLLLKLLLLLLLLLAVARFAFLQDDNDPR